MVQKLRDLKRCYEYWVSTCLLIEANITYKSIDFGVVSENVNGITANSNPQSFKDVYKIFSLKVIINYQRLFIRISVFQLVKRKVRNCPNSLEIAMSFWNFPHTHTQRKKKTQENAAVDNTFQLFSPLLTGQNISLF